MFFDVYLVVLTGFAIFGIYCFLDMILAAFYSSKMPKSITMLGFSADSYTMRKVKYIENVLPNNSIVFFSKDNQQSDTITNIVFKENLVEYIQTALFTKP